MLVLVKLWSVDFSFPLSPLEFVIFIFIFYNNTFFGCAAVSDLLFLRLHSKLVLRFTWQCVPCWAQGPLSGISSFVSTPFLLC